LLDAVALVAAPESPAAHAPTASLARMLDELESRVRGDAAAPGASDALLSALSAALDVEIERWQERAAHDRDARAVLRAFLGLREVLWELGVRPSGAPARGTAQKERDARGSDAQNGRPHAAPPDGRVQRVRVRVDDDDDRARAVDPIGGDDREVRARWRS
ncbi:MAG: hypothetical protein KC560_07650, partial [Myxococcales bacterium]|nr:hypothetical protein [Myxococcales bacterium]